MSNGLKYKSLSHARTDWHKDYIKREVGFLSAHDLTPNQVLYLKFLFFDEYTQLFKYCGLDFKKPKRIKVFQKGEINELHDKGFTTKKWLSTEQFPDNIGLEPSAMESLSQLFGVDLGLYSEIKKDEKNKMYFINQHAEEFYDIYPTNANNYILKACNPITYNGRVYEGKEDILKLYSAQVGYDIETHREVINKIKHDKAKGNLVCCVSITKFVRDKMWTNIETNDTWTEII